MKILEGIMDRTTLKVDDAVKEEKARSAYIASLVKQSGVLYSKAMRFRVKLGVAEQQFTIVRSALTRGINEKSDAGWTPGEIHDFRNWLTIWLGKVEDQLESSPHPTSVQLLIIQHQMVKLLMYQASPDTSDWQFLHRCKARKKRATGGT